MKGLIGMWQKEMVSPMEFVWLGSRKEVATCNLPLFNHYVPAAPVCTKPKAPRPHSSLLARAPRLRTPATRVPMLNNLIDIPIANHVNRPRL